ncbi:MAG: helicase, partial [Desulfobacula sp.]|nr:helicase [Desulfobacula sp.]
MQTLSNDHIRSTIADTQLIFYRGLNTYHHGSYFLSKKDLVKKRFTYEFDGTVGNYTARIHFKGDGVETSCDCPYPRKGCRHVVAGLLNAGEILAGYKPLEDLSMDSEGPNLSEEEIKKQALEDRKKRSVSETFTTIRGDMFKGDHLVINQRSRQYNVTLHDPEKGFGHC